MLLSKQVNNNKIPKQKIKIRKMIDARELDNWHNIKGWEDYFVSNDGRIYSIRRNKLLKVWSQPGKYKRITLSKGGKYKSFTIHRLVATGFIPNPLNKKYVNHKDGNKNNCNYLNLEWCTQSENTIHAIIMGLSVVPVLPSGENHPASKLNNIDIEMIKVLCKHDFTMEQIAKRFNVHQTHISSIKLNKTRKN